MLKKRIKKWELDRNHKQADMVYAVAIALERQAQGKKTSFLIRGRVVTFEEVQHYFRRKGVRDLESLLNGADVTAPTTRIECHTPKPSNLTTADRHSQLRATRIPAEMSATQLHDTGSEITVMPDPNQIAHVLRQSEDLQKFDQLLRYGRDYYNSLFESSDWRTRQKALELSPLENFYHSLAKGYGFLDAGQVTVAFKCFDCAFNLIKRILEDGILLFLPYLYHILLPERGIQQQDVLLKLLEFISLMIGDRFSNLRPVQNSLVILWGMPAEIRGQCSTRVFQCLLEQLKGVFHNNVPDEHQLRDASKVLCTPAQLDPCQESQYLNGYQQTSLAVWKLAKDAELIEESNTSQPAVPGEATVSSHSPCDHYDVHFLMNRDGPLEFNRSPPQLDHFAFHGTHFQLE